MSVERVVFLDRDQAALEALEEGSKARDVALVSLDGLGPPEALRGHRFLLAFIGMRSDGTLPVEPMKELNPKLIIMAPPSAKRKALEMVMGGAFGLLVKPFFPDEVSLLIDRALEEQRVQRELSRMRNLEGLSDLLLERLRHAVKRADPSKKGDLYGFVMRCIETPLLEMVLEETGGNKMKAANILGINRNTLRSKIKELTLPTAG
jgi:DNA-binding protein Fis